MQLQILRYLAHGVGSKLRNAVRRELPFTRIADPYVKRRSPVTVPADIPVDQVFKEFAEASLAHMARIPGHLVVVRDQLILNRRRFDKPALHRIIEQRGFTAPAERVAVLVLLFAVQKSFFGQCLHDVQIAILDETSGKIRHFIRITPLAVHDAHEADAILAAYAIVVFTVRRSHVYNPRTACIGNKGCADHDVRFFRFYIRERRVVSLADQLGTFQRR
ncbi:Uncharacterised protein [Actinobacillus pleuropneumoniae]|nr:Uncharacterised protein [Actinobacillus pleuropneumoniae]